MKTLIVLSACLVAGVPVLAQEVDIGAPPGRLVEIGRRNLHWHCTGTGSPTVILEAGASSFALDWSLVQPDEIHLFTPAVGIQAIQDASAAARQGRRLPARQ